MSVMDQAVDYLLEKASGEKLNLEIMGTESSSTSISFQERKIDQFSFSESRQLGVRLIDGMNEGVAYTESLDRDSLDGVLQEAIANARMIKREWISELHAPSKLPTIDGMFNASLSTVPVDMKINVASVLESTALDYDSRITRVPYARYADGAQKMWLANTKGLRGSYQMNACQVYTSCLAKDGENAVSAGEYEAHHAFEKLDAAKVAKTAAQKTLDRIGASRPDTGKYTIVFENRVAESLIGMIGGYFSGKAVDEKTSPLIGKLGQKMFSSELTITDDPFFRDGAGTRPFDDEGYASKVTTLVNGGTVNSYLTNSVLARKLKLDHTASAARAPSTDLDVSISNLVVKPGSQSFDALLNADSKVILITSVLGMAGFRATSGDFSIPVEGHLYENGKRSRPLKDFLISGNVLQLFSAIEAVGNDARPPTGNIICPSLLVRGLNVAGQA